MRLSMAGIDHILDASPNDDAEKIKCALSALGVVWRGVAWRGVAWRGVAWRGLAWCGVGSAIDRPSRSMASRIAV